MTPWRKCYECKGNFQNEKEHFKYECPENSPVAGLISIGELARAIGFRETRQMGYRVKKYKLKTIKFDRQLWISKPEYERFLREDGRLVAGSIRAQARKLG